MRIVFVGPGAGGMNSHSSGQRKLLKTESSSASEAYAGLVCSYFSILKTHAGSGRCRGTHATHSRGPVRGSFPGRRGGKHTSVSRFPCGGIISCQEWTTGRTPGDTSCGIRGQVTGARAWSLDGQVRTARIRSRSFLSWTNPGDCRLSVSRCLK